jgi:hypothetical protein
MKSFHAIAMLAALGAGLAAPAADRAFQIGPSDRSVNPNTGKRVGKRYSASSVAQHRRAAHNVRNVRRHRGAVRGRA